MAPDNFAQSGGITRKKPAVRPAFRLHHQAANVRQGVVDDGDETRTISTVDHAVVEGQGDRQHQARHELFTIPHRLHRRLGDAEDSHFRRVHDRREVGGAQAADAGDGEAAALHFAGGQLAIARFFGDGHQLARKLDDAFLVHIFEHRYNQAVRGIHRHADVDVFFQRQTLTVFRQRAVKARHLLKGSGNGFHDEDNRGDLHIQLTLLSFGVLLLTERFQIGDIGFVEVRNVRDHHPVTAQVRARDFLDAAQFHFFHFTKLAEVHFRPRQQTRQRTTGRASGRCGFCTFNGVFHVSLNVFAQDAAFTTGAFHFREVHAEFARQAADQRRRVDVSVVFSKFRFAFGFRRSRSRFVSFRRRSRSRRFLFRRRSRRRRCAFYFEDHDKRPGGDFIAHVHLQLFHGTCERCRNFHRGFVAFYGDKRLFSGDFVAHFHQHFGHFDFIAADIRHVDVFRASGCRRCRCRLLGNLRFGFSRRRSARHFEDHNQGASGNFVAGVDFDLFHGTRERRRDFHRGFVAFYGDKRLLGFNFVAHFHQDLGDFDFVAADIRYVNVFCCRGCRCCCRSGFFLLFSLRRCSGCCTFGGIENHDQFAGFDFVAHGHFDLFDHARLRRRDFHRGFVAFYGDQRLFSFNLVAHFDQDLGDFNFVRPDVRYIDFDSHSFFTSYARRGLTFSASILNLVIASATTFLSISPRLASSPSAATTT
ncbi:hypothetical protein ESA_03221 [Cronobacter sakazakii ATCC BAA-894]|uniref:Uncharacterized protein n=1 Tax=Cronobacter sakazakii (strain ATCC BAA-894) TaxID=290339 RepID=A7MGN4_CROS8|nr:hypothetical protein ESA_03221 [Cronobacter sakazakii ATCC BAA-894]